MSKMEMMGSNTRQIFHALTMLQLEGLPEHFKDIKIVNVYEAPGVVGDDWTTHLNDQGEAWIITPLHYSRGGSRIIRKTLRNCRWDARTLQRKKHGDTSWNERKYKLVENTQQGTNKQPGLQDYTMIEYTSDEDKPKHALCRITIDNKKYTHDILPSATQQPKNMEIDHADAKKEIDHGNKGNKGTTGGDIQNTTGDCNQQILEREVHELRKHFSYAAIRKVLDQSESENLSAANPKEDSTEEPVSNTTHGRCTYTNTMEAGTSTKWQEQAKVEMFESNTYREEPTNLSCDTNRNCLEKNDEQGRNTIYWEQLLSSCNTDDCFELDDLPLDKNYSWSDSQMFESDADVLEPNNSSYNFKTISTEPTENGNHLPIYNQNTIAPGLDTNNNATTEPEDMDWMSYLDLSD